MLVTSSSFVINARAQGDRSGYFPDREDVNLKALTLLVSGQFAIPPSKEDGSDSEKQVSSEEEAEPVVVRAKASRGRGRKKAAPPRYPTRPTKRAKPKTSRQSSKASKSVTPSTPVIPTATHPVFEHTFDITYAINDDDSDLDEDDNGHHAARVAKWRQEENQFMDALAGEFAPTEDNTQPRILDLGVLSLPQHYSSRVILLPPSPDDSKAQECTSERALLRLPLLVDHSFDMGDHDFGSFKRSDVFGAALEMKDAGKARIDASMSIQYFSSNPTPGHLPFQISVKLAVSLLSPTIFDDYSYDISTTVGEAQRRFLAHVFRDHFEYPDNHYTDIPFLYSTLHAAPAIPSALSESIQPLNLLPQLLPFQRSTVFWMLKKEGMTMNEDGEVVSIEHEGDARLRTNRDLPLFWTEVPAPSSISEQGETWYLNVLSGALSEERPVDDLPRGGLLAEEPGLGKTIESIALILLNAPSQHELGDPYWNSKAELSVYPVKGTLIVTPPSLCPQWEEELAKHAPHLKVLNYKGWTKIKIPVVSSRRDTPADSEAAPGLGPKGKGKAAAKSSTKAKGKRKAKDSMDLDEEEDDEGDDYKDWVSYVQKYDVVLTTYTVLQSDLNVARPPVKRPRREAATYQAVSVRSRSPLITVEWQRVLMDEVQLVGGGRAAEMVSFIPRRSSWAVSGTPAKSDVHDLIFTLRFLNVQPLLWTSKHWTRCLSPAYCHTFVDLCERIGVRTIKSEADGLSIPKQTRYVVPIELGMVEKHFYDQALEMALHQLGVDAIGAPIYEGWELDAATLRSWLRKLRQACIHPQVGALGNQGPGANRALGGAVRPIADVLSMMVEQNRQTLLNEKKSLMNARIHLALLTQRTQEPARHKKSLEMLLSIRTDIKLLLNEAKESLAAHDEKGKQLAKEARDRRHAEGGKRDSTATTSKGKGKQRQITPSEDSDGALSDDDESDDEGSEGSGSLPANAEGEEHRLKRQPLTSRVRELRVILHRIEFSLGDLFHTLGKEKEENDAYAAAETHRRSLLKVAEVAANRAIAKLTREVLERGVQEDELEIAFTTRPGIKTERLFEEADDIIEILNEQRVLLWEWRGHIFELLTEKINADGTGEEGADGNEYQRALDTQVEVEAYQKEYSNLISDRKEVLTQERTMLAAHDDREKKLRHTRAAMRAAAALDNYDIDVDMLEDDVQVDDELVKQLADKRKDCRVTHNSKRALKSVMIDLNAVINSTNRSEEIQIAKDESLRLRRVIATQTALMDRLATEQAPFRAAFNGRITYFRQLQELSDSVAEIELDQLLADALADVREEIQLLNSSIGRRVGRQRFLDYMQKSQDEVQDDDESRECGICCCEFEKGVLLECAHIYCTHCYNAWRKKGDGMGKRCPACRVEIDTTAVHRITYGRPKDSAARRPVAVQDSQDVPERTAVKYNRISDADLQAIAQVESFGQYGAKIQTLVRHLLLIEEREPGCKSIIFSAFADSLHIIEHGLQANGITCVRIDKTGSKNAAHEFRVNPAIRVILLHGERENSGLNLTVAKRVFLVEPTSSNSFEIQAIARVDRMGQANETEVYCYYATDTVEENILDIGAKNGTSLYTAKNASAAVDLVASNVGKQVVDAPNRDKKVLKGDFVASAEAMFEILFPHLFKDDDGDVEMQDKEGSLSPALAEMVEEEYMDEQPVAGPSRQLRSKR